MKKRGLSPVELKKVVQLRQLGARWTEIEQETKVERRAAKRAYEEWEKDKEVKEQQAARFRVAAEAFHEHLNDLIRLAESLISALQVPETLRELNSANEALDQLWIRNAEGQGEPSVTSGVRRARMAWRGRMLLKSLQDHTRGKIQWEALEEWKQSRNNAVQYSKELRLRATEVVSDNLDSCPGLRKRIETAIGDNDFVERITDGAMENIWRGILTGGQEQIHAVKGASVIKEGLVWLEFYERDSESCLFLNDEELAEEVLSICRQVVTNLREGTESDLVRKLTDHVSRMQTRARELEERLDELVLRPIILHTRCDLCPA